tara:strand:- start:143 stop:1732 length:1590 start_codon:yes stop_codon:yes gene_type:complete
VVNRIDWKDPKNPHPDLAYGGNVISTSETHATEAGIDCFRKGGNAIDAALSAAITLTVTEPCSNGIGGDGFSIVAKEGVLYGLNASGKSPAEWSPEYFSRYKSMPVLGWDTVTTPGVVSQWVALHNRFGKLSFKNLFEGAIHHARHGFPLSEKVARSFQIATTVYSDFPHFAAAWLPKGFKPNTGAVFKNPAQADTLEEIAETKGDSFYRGTIAKKIVKHSEASGGSLSLEDLARHRCNWVETVSTSYRGYKVHELPPNGQGLVALIALGILEYFPLQKWDPESPNSIHVKIEAIKVGFAEAFQHICDPDTLNPNTERFLSPEYLENRAKSISMRYAQLAESSVLQDHGTVYLAAADREGTMVSYIQSNFMGFGSGIVIPDTGISMQNRGAGFTLSPGHPNEVGPLKRPYHTIIPAIVTDTSGPLYAFGVMGGHMQPQGHVQVLTRILDQGWNPQASSDAPRWFVTPEFELVFEEGFDKDIVQELHNRGHRIVNDDSFGLYGGYQGIFKLDQGYCGSSDHRKDGFAGSY